MASLTIARGTQPLTVFGPKDYGYRLGILGVTAPLALSVLIHNLGGRVLIVSSGLSLVAFFALCVVRTRERPNLPQTVLFMSLRSAVTKIGCLQNLSDKIALCRLRAGPPDGIAVAVRTGGSVAHVIAARISALMVHHLHLQT